MVTLDQLRQLVAVADHGTLSAAADELILSQPALSRSMQRLEKEFPLPLFDRSPNQVRLTEAGSLVVEEARRVLAQVGAMYAAAREHERRTRTIEIVSCAPAPLWGLLPRIERTLPGMRVTTRVTTQGEVDALVDRADYQLLITTRRPRSPGAGFHCGEEHLYLSVPLTHPAAGCDSIHLADLDGETLLLAPGLGFWGDLVRTRMPNATFLVQDDAAWREIAKASSLPVFTTDLSNRAQQLPGRALVPVADHEANPTYWCLIGAEVAGRLPQLARAFLARSSREPGQERSA